MLSRQRSKKRLTSATEEHTTAAVISSAVYRHDDEEADITSLLRAIYHCKRASQALTYIRILKVLLDGGGDEKVKESNAREIVKLQGLAIIIFSMEKHKDSIKFVTASLQCLVQISCLLPKTRKTIVELNAINTVVDIAISKTSSLLLDAQIMCLFNVLSTSKETRADVSTGKIIDLVIHFMWKFPNGPYFQICACLYLHNIVEVEGKREELETKGVLTLLSKINDISVTKMNMYKQQQKLNFIYEKMMDNNI